ncbi:MAG: helix-turn-helix transcriptional regulator [Ignavibacteria bacterium]|nr:helix-turn-helix transcriptional regulator [Ignavibacteria bacterium]
MKELEQICEDIRKRRKSLGIIQTDLAEISGVSLRSLKEIETGKGNPTLSNLLKILNTLGLKITLTSRIKND